MTVRFWKYHGLGNDFVVLDRRGRPAIGADAARAVCDRHTGVGADGILAFTEDQDGRPHMRVHNADGSVADMCGNGLRCFVRWLVDVHGVPAGGPLVVSTDAGDQRCVPILADDGCVEAVSIDLGAPRFQGRATLEVGGQRYEGDDLFLGNPHFVVVREPAPGEPAANGYALSVHPHFPRGANIEWLVPTSRRTARLVVYERGCGLTRACGTGGAGAAASAVQQGLLDADADLTITQPGGDLVYRVARDFGEVWMTGPAEPVFEGVLSSQFPVLSSEN